MSPSSTTASKSCAAGGTVAVLSAASVEGAVPHASLESVGLSAITGETDSSQSLADSLFTSSGPVMGAPEAMSSEALAAMAASMAQGSQPSLWNTQDLAARYTRLPTPPALFPLLPHVLLLLLIPPTALSLCTSGVQTAGRCRRELDGPCHAAAVSSHLVMRCTSGE